MVNDIKVTCKVKLKKRFKILVVVMKILLKLKKYELVSKIYNKIVDNPSNYYVAEIDGYKI